MNRADFHFLSTRAQRTRSIAGEYMVLLEEGQSVDDWLRVVEGQNPETALALRAHFAAILYLSTHTRESVNDALAKADEPLFPTVDPGVVAGKGFNTFRSRRGYPSVAAALGLVKDWVIGFGCPMLTLGGAPGTGKTHLAQAAADSLKDMGRTVIYRSEAELIGELMSRMQTKTAEALLEAVCRTPWLVLDDLGVTASSAWNQSILDRVINARYELAQVGEGSTLITTNVEAKDLSARVRRRLTEPGVSKVQPVRAPNYFTEVQQGDGNRRRGSQETPGMGRTSEQAR